MILVYSLAPFFLEFSIDCPTRQLGSTLDTGIALTMYAQIMNWIKIVILDQQVRFLMCRQALKYT